MHACFTDTLGVSPSPVLAESQSAGTIIRPYEIIHRSIDLWLTDSTVCGAGELLQMTSTADEILMEGRGNSRVNIFSTSLVISIFSLSLFPRHPLWCHTNASLLFHWAHWHGRSPPPQWCTGPKVNSPSLLSTTAGEKGWERKWMSKVRAGGLIKSRSDD